MRARGTLLALWVLGLLGATAAALVGVAVGVVRQSVRAPALESLEYATLLRAVDELIALEGTPALRVVGADTVLHGRRVRYDTLVVEEGPATPPSLRLGGFLHTEVQRYNAFQRDWIELAAEEASLPAALRAYNPSIFRSRPDGDGGLEVTRTAAAWSRRVQSPRQDTWTGDVRTVDARTPWALVSPRLGVPLDRPARFRPEGARRGRACTFDVAPPDARVHCLSEARTAQAVFRDVIGASGVPLVRAGWTGLSVDGQRIEPGDSVRLAPGAVVAIEPLAPTVFTTLSEGVLSGQQWIDGRVRRRGVERPPLDLVAGVGIRPLDPERAAASDADLVVSVDAELTRALTTELDTFLSGLGTEPEFGALVLSRIPDGAVVALAEAGERSEPGRSRLLERVVPGSAVKPLLAAAILSQRSDLGSLAIPARAGRITQVRGAPAVPASRAFRSDLNCAPPATGRVDLRYFLRCSNNEYAATLLVAGLTPSDVAFARAGAATRAPVGRTVAREALIRSPLSEGMAALFDVSTDPVIVDRQGRSVRIWEGLRFSDGAPVRVPPAVRPDASRPVLLGSPEAEETDLGLLYRYAFGAWENRWTLFDLTEGFARITSDRRVRVSLAPGAAAPEPLGLSGQRWYPALMGGLAAVAVDGTASGLAERFRRAGVPGTLYAKTGTLAEDEERSGNGLYLKALLFSVGEADPERAGALRCGVAGALYLRFREGVRRGPLPGYQIDFAEERLARFLADHWDRLGACPEAPEASSPPTE